MTLLTTYFSVSSVSVTSTSEASSSTRKGELSTTGRDSDTTIEEIEKVKVWSYPSKQNLEGFIFSLTKQNY